MEFSTTWKDTRRQSSPMKKLVKDFLSATSAHEDEAVNYLGPKVNGEV